MISALWPGLIQRVSIPFKRESVFRVVKPSETSLELRFNSLQTGKCIQSLNQAVIPPRWYKVSIPFKRESVFRVSMLSFLTRMKSCFNSLQTGKCIQRLILATSASAAAVTAQSFNSLQTGKCIQSRQSAAFPNTGPHRAFQFPSNGKVYSETGTTALDQTSFVSIPFKRESVFRAFYAEWYLKGSQFQFPSNGKVYSERPYFKLSGSVAPYAQNQTRSSHASF